MQVVPLQSAPYRLAHFAEKDVRGPAVTNNVVCGEQKRVQIVFEFDELDPNQRPRTQIERCAGFFMDQVSQALAASIR